MPRPYSGIPTQPQTPPPQKLLNRRRVAQCEEVMAQARAALKAAEKRAEEDKARKEREEAKRANKEKRAKEETAKEMAMNAIVYRLCERMLEDVKKSMNAIVYRL